MKQKLNGKAIAVVVAAIAIIAMWLLTVVFKVLPESFTMPLYIVAFLFLVVLLIIMLRASGKKTKKR